MRATIGAQPPPFGAALKHYRVAAHLTQEELAERARVSRLTISALERGARQVPHRDTVRRLAEALELPERDRGRLEAAARRAGNEAGNGVEGSHPTPMDVLWPPLAGRAREMDLLERHVEGAGPPLLAVAGEPGIGKTRLLQETARYAELYGLRVLQGGGERRRGAEPYAPLAAGLSHHLRHLDLAHRHSVMGRFPWLVRVVPELGGEVSETLPSLPAEQERRLVAESVAAYLTSPDPEAGNGSLGTLLVLDDLQWAGPDALELLGALARYRNGNLAEYVPLRILGGYRDTEVSPEDALSTVLADLAPSRLATLLPLGPLRREESAELLTSLLNAEEGLDPILQRAGGVPFFLMSWAQDVQSGATPGKNGAPMDLVQSIRARIAALPEGAREVLGAAAVIGQTFRHDLLLSVSGQEEGSVVRVLDAAQRARLLMTEDEGRSRFAYGVVREVAELELGSAHRMVVMKRLMEIRDL